MRLHQVNEHKQRLSFFCLAVGAQVAQDIAQRAHCVALEVSVSQPERGQERVHGRAHQQGVVHQVIVDPGGKAAHESDIPLKQPGFDSGTRPGNVGQIGYGTAVVVKRLKATVQTVLDCSQQGIVAEADSLVPPCLEQLSQGLLVVTQRVVDLIGHMGGGVLTGEQRCVRRDRPLRRHYGTLKQGGTLGKLVNMGRGRSWITVARKTIRPVSVQHQQDDVWLRW